MGRLSAIKVQLELELWDLQGNRRFSIDSQSRIQTVIQGQGHFTKCGLPRVIPCAV